MRLSCLAALCCLLGSQPVFAQRIEANVRSEAALHGHLVVILAKNDKSEPRMQMSENYLSAQGFGVDAGLDPAGASPSKALVIDAQTIGFPRHSLTDLDPGDYWVQGVFNVYEEFHPANGKAIWLPPDRGEGQHWNNKPGNLYSKPVRIHLDPKSPNDPKSLNDLKSPKDSKTPRPGSVIQLTLDQIIPPIEGGEHDPAMIAAKQTESKWLKWMRFRSEKLSQFWGRDMYLGAWILLPDGFDDHPSAHYPLVVWQDHFNANVRPSFSAVPPPAGDLRGAAGYRFFQDWTTGRVPRVILLYVQNANPFYDDSYVVDSANVGPYGAAINDELIPLVEQKYRGLGQGWARATAGGSTGGWEALATQVFYPDRYNGAYAACPDPVDFHGYQNIDLYNDRNAFVRKGDFGEVPIAADRKPDGSVIATSGLEFAYEYVLGTHGRSTEQWSIWQAVYSPKGEDGYPAEVIDPLTGAIDKQVVQYWHDHYDLAAILKRDWPALGPKLEGKLHIAVGDGDTYFLNNAVHLLQTQLEATRNPHSDATFQYGPGMPHCYTGGPAEYSMQQNNANWAQRVLPEMTRHMLSTAPNGADIRSWIY